MDIAILLYDRLTGLDAVGPYEVLSRLPGSTLTFVAAVPGPKRTDTGRLALVADAGLDELPRPDIVVVPGGPGQAEAEDDQRVLDWLRGAHESTERVVVDGKIVTAAGVSAGIDMALRLAALIAGDEFAQAVQLGLEYDPQPPFDAGSPAKAPEPIVETLCGASRFVLEGR